MGMETFVAASDYHGDRRDSTADKLFRRFVADFKPKRRYFLGDLWDFRALRSGATEDEKKHSMKEDFERGLEFFQWYKPDVFLLGNHDQRLWDAVSKDGFFKTGPIADYAAELIERFDAAAEEIGTVILPYDKRKGVYRHNGQAMVHGFDNMVPMKMASTYGNVMYGHGHAIVVGASPDDEAAPVARQIGSLCLTDMDYNRGQLKTLAQQNGWAYGAHLDHKRNAVMQATVTGSSVVFAETFKTLAV
jgi:hypothetical protein